MKTWKENFENYHVRERLMESMETWEYYTDYNDMLRKEYVDKAFKFIAAVKEQEGIYIPLLLFRETYFSFSVSYMDSDCDPDMRLINEYLSYLKEEVEKFYTEYENFLTENENLL